MRTVSCNRLWVLQPLKFSRPVCSADTSLLKARRTPAAGTGWLFCSVSPARSSGLLLYLRRTATQCLPLEFRGRGRLRAWRLEVGSWKLEVGSWKLVSFASCQYAAPDQLGCAFCVGKGGDRAAGGGHEAKLAAQLIPHNSVHRRFAPTWQQNPTVVCWQIPHPGIAVCRANRCSVPAP